MSDDMQETFQIMKMERQKNHANWKRKNIEVLEKSNVPFKVSNGGECYSFRLPEKPPVDFYPSTGRWRVVGNSKNRSRSGGATKFLLWYMAIHEG